MASIVSTVVPTFYPFATHCLIVVALGLPCAYMTSRPVLASLVSASVVLACACLLRQWLPFAFRVLVEEGVIEPLLGKESPAVLAIFFLVPTIFIAGSWWGLRGAARRRE